MNECSSPNFVSGLIQADGVSTRFFFIAFEKIKQSKLGLNAPSQKSLYLSSRSALEAVQAFFQGIGKIDDNAKKHSAELVIDSLDQLRHLIIPHFYQYPLYGTKQYAFLVFVSIEKIKSIITKKYFQS